MAARGAPPKVTEALWGNASFFQALLVELLLKLHPLERDTARRSLHRLQADDMTRNSGVHSPSPSTSSSPSAASRSAPTDVGRALVALAADTEGAEHAHCASGGARPEAER